MILTSIKLSHFRNFDNREFVFNKSLTIIYGQNARGKTNILESIYFISNGSGFRESKESELLSFDTKIGLGSVEGVYKSTSGSSRNKITLRRQGESVEKIFFVNNTKRRSSQYIEDQIKTVLFSPEQMELITGSPDKRRVYFNRCISFYDPEYKKRVDNYDTALRKRNKVLEMHKDRSAVLKELEYWNDYLIEQANYITKTRQEYILFLNNNPSLDHKSFTIDYKKNIFSRERLKEKEELELRIRKTVIGPQKDDFEIYIKVDSSNGKSVHHFGSRSEQRFAILWLKLCEIKYHEVLKKQKPILLLDDVFSEFDTKNKKIILELVKDYQSILTTTEKEITELKGFTKTIIKL